MGRVLTLALAIVIAGFAALPAARAAELVMLERPGCVWCARWNADIAPAYPKTEEGRTAPLRRVDISGGWPDDLDGIGRDIVTPTFILIEDGREVARLRGYPGPDFFWPLLGNMLAKLESPATGTTKKQ